MNVINSKPTYRNTQRNNNAKIQLPNQTNFQTTPKLEHITAHPTKAYATMSRRVFFQYYEFFFFFGSSESQSVKQLKKTLPLLCKTWKSSSH